MLKRNIFRILLCLLAIGGFSWLFFMYLSIPLESYISFLPKNPMKEIESISDALGLSSGKIAFTGLTLAQNLSLPGEAFSAGIFSFAWRLALVTSVFCLGCLVMAFFQKTWSNILGMMFSLLGILWNVLVLVFFLPNWIMALFDTSQTMSGLWDILESLFGMSLVRFSSSAGSVSMAGVRSWVFSCLGIGYKVTLLCLLLLFVGFILAQVFCARSQNFAGAETEPRIYPRPPITKEAGIICEFGECNGLKAVMQPGEKMIIGRDVERCNLVLKESDIDSVHCIISYDGKEYQVQDLSYTGITCEKIRLDKETINIIPREMTLCLGTEANRIFLD